MGFEADDAHVRSNSRVPDKNENAGNREEVARVHPPPNVKSRAHGRKGSRVGLPHSEDVAVGILEEIMEVLNLRGALGVDACELGTLILSQELANQERSE
jgi:hypothetical protein